MKYLTIIQTRTNSSRLPGKCFLPLCGIPTFQVCAERAATDFSDLIFAISNDPQDDFLASLLADLNIPFYRGSLSNVLQRFVDIVKLKNMDEADTVIRLTGDNPIVDAEFLQKMKVIWETEKLDYLSAQPEDLGGFGWPKGLSAEFVRAGDLLASLEQDSSAENQEHVTPFIRASCVDKGHMGVFHDSLYCNGLSLSVDRLEDYLFVARVFQKAGIHAEYLDILRAGTEEL